MNFSSKDIPRTAAFAWCPNGIANTIVTGTRAGAVDADFSNQTTLEVWDVFTDNSSPVNETRPLASLDVDSRFYDLAWSHSTSSFPNSTIAGALENGSVDLWSADRLTSGLSDAFIARIQNHSGPVKALQFNPFRHELLASAGSKGELYVTDINYASNAFRIGSSGVRADDFEAIDWNHRVSHILATGSNGGFITVWDIKSKKESLSLNNMNRKPVSAIVWNPDNPTRLACAVPSPQDPLIVIWDLRNSNAPEKVWRAHDQGVLSLSWCQQDSTLLVSSGKDHRIVFWDPGTGECLGELQPAANWTFQTRFNPKNPNFLATASFDGRVAIRSIQNTNSEHAKQQSLVNQTLNDEEFFAKAQSQPHYETFSLPKAPKWLERPVCASFGFGGKLVQIYPVQSDGATGGYRQSKLIISDFAVDSDFEQDIREFEVLLSQGSIASICQAKIQTSHAEEDKADWTVLEQLSSGNLRKQLQEFLGFSRPSAAFRSDRDDIIPSSQASAQGGGGIVRDERGENEADVDAASDLLSQLCISKGVRINSPFCMYNSNESELDRQLTRLLLMGSFNSALEICLRENRFSDGLMIAMCGGPECVKRAQTAYLTGRYHGPSYLRLLLSIARKDLWDLVYNTELANWRDVMAILCTYASDEQFPDLCEALGDRIQEVIELEPSRNRGLRKDATLCYLAGSKLEKAVVNWAQELHETEIADLQTTRETDRFAAHFRSLQNFIEKVSIFRRLSDFIDSDLQDQSISSWKLAALYNKYIEFADITASLGHLKIAEKYLDLVPSRYANAEIARNRVKQATKSSGTGSLSKSSRDSYKPLSNVNSNVNRYNQRSTMPMMVNPQSSYHNSGYGSVPLVNVAPNIPNPPGVSPNTTPSTIGLYQPVNPQAPVPSAYSYMFPSSDQLGNNIHRSTSTAAVLAPSQSTTLSNWNDAPDLGPPKPASRTPNLENTNMMSAKYPRPNGGYTSGFGDMNQHMGKPPTPSVPPPPKGPSRAASRAANRAPLPPPGQPVLSSATVPPVSGHNYYQATGSTPSATNSSARAAYTPNQTFDSNGQPIDGQNSMSSLPYRGSTPYNAPVMGNTNSGPGSGSVIGVPTMISASNSSRYAPVAGTSAPVPSGGGTLYSSVLPPGNRPNVPSSQAQVQPLPQPLPPQPSHPPLPPQSSHPPLPPPPNPYASLASSEPSSGGIAMNSSMPGKGATPGNATKNNSGYGLSTNVPNFLQNEGHSNQANNTLFPLNTMTHPTTRPTAAAPPPASSSQSTQSMNTIENRSNVSRQPVAGSQSSNEYTSMTGAGITGTGTASSLSGGYESGHQYGGSCSSNNLPFNGGVNKQQYSSTQSQTCVTSDCENVRSAVSSVPQGTGLTNKSGGNTSVSGGSGDQGLLNPITRPIYEILSADMKRVVASAPKQYQREVNDTAKRLDILLNALKGEDTAVLSVVNDLTQISQSIKCKDYSRAEQVTANLISSKPEFNRWLIGIRRLIMMSRNTKG